MSRPTRLKMSLVALTAGAALLALLVGSARGAYPGMPGRIAFKITPAAGMDLATMNPDGSDIRQLTFAPNSDGDAAYSPDGTQIAFRSARTGDQEIWLMGADGSNQRQITFSPGDDNEPYFSPSGAQIVFRSDRAG